MSRSRALLGTVAAMLVLAASWGTGMTLGALSDTTQNAGNTFTAAASFCSSPGNQNVGADADAALIQQAPGMNFGTFPIFHVQSHSGSRNRRGVLHFPLPAIPANCTLTAATLRLNATSAAVGRTLDVYRLAAAWTETSITWTNQPTTTGAASSAPSASGWVQWDVLAQVQAMYSGANNGFLVRDRYENAGSARLQVFRTREDTTNIPELVLTFA